MPFYLPAPIFMNPGPTMLAPQRRPANVFYTTPTTLPTPQFVAYPLVAPPPAATFIQQRPLLVAAPPPPMTAATTWVAPVYTVLAPQRLS